ncbi:MAG: IPTL-CTERM sorting domain-containing protein [Pseudomonadota bacterium]
MTDDPGVGGATDPTTFVVQSNNVSGNMTVSGTYTIGSMVAYTVTLSNSGTATQADNAGNEFSDVLPAGLTLVSANASSGTAVTAGNTATWNGSLASLGGSVTITINATVNAGTQGTTISNQGTVSYDADGNGSNESTAMTDDPAVGGATDPTAFVVQSASVSGSMTVGGSFSTGNTVTYTVVLSNSGSAATLDNAGNEFTDLLPAALALVSANASAGTAVANTGTGTVSWNGSIPAGGSVTMTITATVNSGAASGTVVSNQGTVSVDTDLNGTNETAVSTDDPAVGGANDPTVFTVNGVAVSATKVVSGSFVRGGTVSYTIVLSNAGNAATADNPGNEFTDVLPASLILVSATASSGTAVASVGTNTVTWNGSIPASGSVTIMITATIDSSIPAGNTVQVINQGSFAYDADLNGTNESTGVTNDPAAVGGTPGSNATGFQLAAAVVPLPAAIPTVSELALLLMGLGLLAMAWMRERRGSRV